MSAWTQAKVEVRDTLRDALHERGKRLEWEVLASLVHAAYALPVSRPVAVEAMLAIVEAGGTAVLTTPGRRGYST